MANLPVPGTYPDAGTPGMVLLQDTGGAGTSYLPVSATNGMASVSRGLSNLATSQVAVGTTVTLIAAARSGRGSIKITNLTGAQQIFVGGPAVTLANGDLLPASIGASVTIPSSAAIYGIAVTAAQTVTVSEVF